MKLRKMAVAHYLPQTRFDVHERRRQPALALARVLPVVDLGAAFLDEGIDRFKAVRRFERTAQHRVHAEAMQRQRLPQTFVQAGSCGLIPLFQLTMDLREGS